jgi:hypothetical protein
MGGFLTENCKYLPGKFSYFPLGTLSQAKLQDMKPFAEISAHYNMSGTGIK